MSEQALPLTTSLENVIDDNLIIAPEFSDNESVQDSNDLVLAPEFSDEEKSEYQYSEEPIFKPGFKEYGGMLFTKEEQQLNTHFLRNYLETCTKNIHNDNIRVIINKWGDKVNKLNSQLFIYCIDKLNSPETTLTEHVQMMLFSDPKFSLWLSDSSMQTIVRNNEKISENYTFKVIEAKCATIRYMRLLLKIRNEL